MLLGKEKIQNIIVEVKKLAHPDPVEIRIRSQQSLFLRMSQSSLHQNTFEDNYTIHINLYGNKKRVATHTNDFSKTSLKKAVSYLKRDLQTVPEDPYLTLFPEIKRNMELKNVTEDTSSRDPKILAEFCKPILEKSRSHHLIASGQISSGVTEYAVSNSLNDYLCYQIRSDGCLTTVCEGDEQSSSWNSWAGKSFKTLDIKEYTEDFIFRSLLSRKPQDIEAGTYPVILSRFAVSTLLQYMMWLALSGKTFEEGTSAFSGKLNSQVFDPQFNLSDDPIVSTDFPQIFDAYGEEKKKLSVIEKGVLKNVSYNHYYANRFQKPSTASEVFGSGSGFTHLKLHAGKKSFQELIQETEKAILVTRFWYVNASNPRSLTFTGVTKDGTFLIENGKIAKPIRKLRFTESLLKAFSKVDAISKDAAWVPETSFYEGRYLFAYWCPAIKLSEFHFSS